MKKWTMIALVVLPFGAFIAHGAPADQPAQDTSKMSLNASGNDPAPTVITQTDTASDGKLSIKGKQKKIEDLTSDDIKSLTDEQLVNLPMETLLFLANKLGISIDQLLNMKSTVAAKSALSPRESPAIITIITDEEIQNSGARDLIDVLRLVPGFDFGYDCEGVIGIGIRGVWGHEGKVLLMIDGQEFNELYYSTLQFANHFDVNQIKRIEILRGPGSCVYGGFAELAVINVITKKSDDYNGMSATVEYGQQPDAPGLMDFSIGAGKCYNKFDISLKAFGSIANISDRTFTDNSGFEYPANSGIGRTSTLNANLNVNAADFSGRFIFDKYETNTTDFFSVRIDKPLPIDFYTYLGELEYQAHFGENLTITPKLNFKYQLPYNNTSDTTFSAVYYDKGASRTTGNILATYDIGRNLSLLGGVEEFEDHATSFDYQGYEVPFMNGTAHLDYFNTAVFAQALFKLKVINFILSGRYDYQNLVGGAFSPRLALTGIVNKFDYKIMFSQAFRAPGLENIDEGIDIKPEKTTDYEMELGYCFTDNIFLTANLFDITLTDPIIYYSDSAGNEWYQNSSRTGSAGVELELKYRCNWGYGALSYSYYNADLFAGSNLPFANHFDKNFVETYQVPGNTSALLGFPNHKVAFNCCFPVRNWSIDPSAVFFSRRYVCTSIDSLGNPTSIGTLDPSVALNLYARCRNCFVNGLTVGFGVDNILNQKIDFVQPYSSGGHPPYPGTSLELLLKLTYDLGF